MAFLHHALWNMVVILKFDRSVTHGIQECALSFNATKGWCEMHGRQECVLSCNAKWGWCEGMFDRCETYGRQKRIFELQCYKGLTGICFELRTGVKCMQDRRKACCLQLLYTPQRPHATLMIFETLSMMRLGYNHPYPLTPTEGLRPKRQDHADDTLTCPLFSTTTSLSSSATLKASASLSSMNLMTCNAREHFQHYTMNTSAQNVRTKAMGWPHARFVCGLKLESLRTEAELC
eukprot:1161469-Pelagomonas_calceolata.AAC.46